MAVAMLLPCYCHVIVMRWPCYRHVIAMLLPTSSVPQKNTPHSANSLYILMRERGSQDTALLP
eukprot:11186499-Lingulodinium_polyedra.AAC.1